MIYHRDKRFGADKPKLTELDNVAPTIKEEVVEETIEEEAVDVSSLPWEELRAYAKEQGVDLAKYRSKQDIIDQLTK